MKKLTKIISLAAVTVLLTAFNSFGQVTYGPQIGLNMANISGDYGDEDKPKMKIGAHIGGVVVIPFSDMIGVRTGLLYSMKGSKQKSETTYTDPLFGDITTELDGTTSLNYLDIPILLNVQTEGGFNFAVGPMISMLLSAKDKGDATVTFGGFSETESYDEDIKDNLSGIDFGVSANVGFKMESGLGIGGFFNKGFADILDENEGDAFTNTVFGLYVNFMLGGD